MKKLKWIVILLNLVLLLGYFNFSILNKEEILDQGKLVLLELAPVDPRSLMQGDYMTLNYALSNALEDYQNMSKRGYCVVRMDSAGVAERVRFQEKEDPLSEGEYLIPYTLNGWRLNIGAESYFFEEGQGEKYDAAKYGGVKLDNKGNCVLTGLYDEKRRKIE